MRRYIQSVGAGIDTSSNHSEIPLHFTGRPTHPFSFLSLFVLVIVATTGCGSTGDDTPLTTEQRFAKGMKHLEEEDYLDAQREFEVILLQDPAHELADDAQFRLAEAYFKQDEFFTAAFQYSRVLTDFPGSTYYRQALFMTGECYYLVSPQFERDQGRTQRAITQFNAYIQYFPSDSMATIARSRISDLRGRLAERDFTIAKDYESRNQLRAADLYYQRVIDKYPESPFSKQALEAQLEVRRKLQEVSDD